MPYILCLIIYKNILLEDCSCAAPDHARLEPTPSQTKLHVAQRARPARKKKLQKKWIFQILLVLLPCHPEFLMLFATLRYVKFLP